MAYIEDENLAYIEVEKMFSVETTFFRNLRNAKDVGV
jgi:hypothetical protein